MQIEDLLNRLEGVRKTGANHWVAKCPAHTDKSPSLSIACGEDGRILLHDFGGCAVHAVLAAVGLTVGDLFEQRMRPQTPGERREAVAAFRRGSWEAALRVLDRESLVVQAAAAMVRNGGVMTAEDQRVLARACSRIGDARNVLAKGGDYERDWGRIRGGVKAR